MFSKNIELSGKYILTGKIALKTGLHIGGTSETLRIGGADNPVIRDKNGNTFIPGSSLKGKIRSLLEISGYSNERYEKEKDGKPCGCGTCQICKIFGSHNSKNIVEPNRIIVRDSYIIGNTFESTEVKPENTINRIKGAAEHPRFIERITEGTEFDFEIVFNNYGNDKELLKLFLKGMALLEDDYLGGSGTRGYGKVKFEGMSLEYRPKEYYEGNKDKALKMVGTTNELSEVISNL